MNKIEEIKIWNREKGKIILDLGYFLKRNTFSTDLEKISQEDLFFLIKEELEKIFKIDLKKDLDQGKILIQLVIINTENEFKVKSLLNLADIRGKDYFKPTLITDLKGIAFIQSRQDKEELGYANLNIDFENIPYKNDFLNFDKSFKKILLITIFAMLVKEKVTNEIDFKEFLWQILNGFCLIFLVAKNNKTYFVNLTQEEMENLIK